LSFSEKRTIAAVLPLFFGLCVLLGAGCAPSSYHYFAVNDNCNCEEYRTEGNGIKYAFRANYRMEGGILTGIEIEIHNETRDTLSLDLATVRIYSRNISYQYNNKFLPLSPLKISPGKSEIVRLAGKEVSGTDDWHEIAGERLTVTIRGLALGGRLIGQQEVEFVPENPKLKK